METFADASFDCVFAQFFLSLSILDKKEELFNIIFHTHESTQWNDFFSFRSLFCAFAAMYAECSVWIITIVALFFQPNGFPESERDWSSYMELYSVVSSHSFICLSSLFVPFRYPRQSATRTTSANESVGGNYQYKCIILSYFFLLLRRVVNSAASVSMCMEMVVLLHFFLFFLCWSCWLLSRRRRRTTRRSREDYYHILGEFTFS